MPERLYKMLREPGEGVAAFFAVAGAFLTGGVVSAVGPERDVWGYIASGIGGVITVLIVYYFKDRMKGRDTSLAMHT